jgi:hypothetical protein
MGDPYFFGCIVLHGSIVDSVKGRLIISAFSTSLSSFIGTSKPNHGVPTTLFHSTYSYTAMTDGGI